MSEKLTSAGSSTAIHYLKTLSFSGQEVTEDFPCTYSCPLLWPQSATWTVLVVFVAGRNKVVAKVMFLLVSVILFTGGGGSTSVHAVIPPPGSTHPPGSIPPPPEADTLLGSTHPSGSMHPLSPPPPGSRLRHTVNERPVRILLECILVIVLHRNLLQ